MIPPSEPSAVHPTNAEPTNVDATNADATKADATSTDLTHPDPLDARLFLQALAQSPLAPWQDTFAHLMAQALAPGKHGDLARWCDALNALPAINISSTLLNQDVVTAGLPTDCDDQTRTVLTEALQGLHPWRKGPFNIAGVHIDTEWHSDWKWQRVAPHLAPLHGRCVLDVGCGSGYHLWRMAGEGARYVLGIDPSLLFLCQFYALRRYLGQHSAHFLPVGIEALPPNMGVFDTVFSMGVLYHRRSPIDHLMELKGQLRTGGQLVLETLVVDGDEHTVLVPSGRYARMGNVWFLPSVAMLLVWMRKLGFKNPRVVDVGVTTTEEQRTTPWMRFQSLADFLDAQDAARTCEGYPAPKRAVVVAET